MQNHGELCVCDLHKSLKMSQPKVSRHLSVLRSSGIISHRRKGSWVYYCLHRTYKSSIEKILDAVKQDKKLMVKAQMDLKRLSDCREKRGCDS
jgi:ArsR family transcriptional regulator